MDALEFEAHVAWYYRQLGYRIEMTKASGDQGIDVIAENDVERIGIQVKRYSGSVGNSAVQEVVAGLRHYGCSRGVVVTTSAFTRGAIALARSNGVELIDGYAYGRRYQAVERRFHERRRAEERAEIEADVHAAILQAKRIAAVKGAVYGAIERLRALVVAILPKRAPRCLWCDVAARRKYGPKCAQCCAIEPTSR
jgi:predicted RecB family endonuclease